MKLNSLVAVLSVVACASTKHIEGTEIDDTPENREVVEAIERYRRALERRDVANLIALAHPWYFEDSGTAKGDDDYGYDGLKKILASRMAEVQAVRYGLRYKSLRIAGNRAKVQVFLDASFQLLTEQGPKWERKVDDNEFELLKDAKGWRFLTGM